MLNNALKRNNSFEKYTTGEAASSGITAAFNSFLIVLSMLFFALEVFLMYYAIIIAVKCTKGGAERVVHVVLATIFTLPYMLLNAMFNKCAINILQSN